ncbi:MAG: AAA family ATPase [Bacteroidetes bacterium]|jgi:putative ATP-dependent endonuclease of the OLD family|nr:AAA family ATPase [Bacteroidota bacterium]MBT6688083.1 AAA family ATPase [Bacteroidota bacterium]MBT7142336.1 AAA family ATPase [Bacteroidota bacterium]MBT7491150.1 AAA family ATPase [Bacteroidota bacterium]
MKITKIEIKNFRNHKETSIKLTENTVLIGKNNTGKTSFLEAIRFALDRTGRKRPTEDDFYTTDTFNPQAINPLEIKLEFKETKKDRFSSNIIDDFQGIWQYDTETTESEEPLRYIKLAYSCKYNSENKETEIDRYFENNEGNKIEDNLLKVSKQRLSYFPFFYLDALRDIKKQINYKSSFWGDLKKDIEYDEETQNKLQTQIDKINELLLSHTDINELKNELNLLQKNINQSTGELYLQAFSKRNWELLDQLDIFIRNSETNLGLPVSKHGSGTQNIATFLIFKAYINLLLPKIVENKEAFPIIAIEEPEAHIHPQAQRELFEEIKKLKGQKIISTHSPFIAEQTDIYDYILLRNQNGIAKAQKIDEFIKYLPDGLPSIAYKKNKTLADYEEHLIKRYAQYKHPELFFSNLFILCEGDSEKLFLEQIITYHKNKTIGQLGISVINCDGKNYSAFLKLANILKMNWIIFSDGELDTKQEVKNQINNSGFNFENEESNVLFIPENFDFEKCYLDFYGTETIENFIKWAFKEDTFDKFIEKFKSNLSETDNIENYSKELLLNKFIDKIGKPRIAEKLAEYIIQEELEIPEIIRLLIEKAYCKTI